MELDDASFLAAAGIAPDYTWLIERLEGTVEQQRFVLDLLRIQSMMAPRLRKPID